MSAAEANGFSVTEDSEQSTSLENGDTESVQVLANTGPFSVCGEGTGSGNVSIRYLGPPA